MAALGILLLLILNASSAFARLGSVKGSNYYSSRASAMGEAALPLADDPASVLFYNPAHVSRIKGLEIEPINFMFYMNEDLVDIVDENIYKLTDLGKFSDTLRGSPKKFPGFGSQYVASVGIPGFAVGILYSEMVMAKAKNAEGEEYRYISEYQLIPAAAAGIGLAHGIVRWGVGAQLVNRAYGDIKTNIPVSYNDQLKQGTGLSYTGAFAFTLPYTMLPAFNIVYRNVIPLTYADRMFIPMVNNPAGVLDPESGILDASFSMKVKIGRGFHENVVLEYRDALNESVISPLFRFAAGLEVGYHDFVYLRAGFGSLQYNAGAGFHFKNTEVNISWNAPELGKKWQELPDRRYAVQYQVRF